VGDRASFVKYFYFITDGPYKSVPCKPDIFG
jgi:hypothetical protein